MKFELSPEIMDQIIFGMEDQANLSFFDSVDLLVVSESEALAIDGQMESGNAAIVGSKDSGGSDYLFAERFLPLPEWKSVDGFNLMEGFVASLRNPVQRENLRQILQSGRGVFRQFKDALKERKDIERLWFRFKQKEMQRRVSEWYNELRVFWGLEPLSLEEEAETEDLLLSDFVFLTAGPELSNLFAQWDRRLFEDMFPQVTADEREFLYQIRRNGVAMPAISADSVVIRSCTPLGENAGFIWILEHELSGPGGISRIARILQIGVETEYRGLGMGTALIHYYQKTAQEKGITRILVEVPHSAEFIGRSLQREGFLTHSVTWELDLTSNA